MSKGLKVKVEKVSQSKKKKFGPKLTVKPESGSPRSSKMIAGKRRWKPGTVALRQIRKMQKGTDTLIARAPFARLVKQIAAAQSVNGFRWQRSALAAAHEATEAYIIGLLGDANLCALHARRVTMMPRDLHLARRLRGN